MNITVNQTVSYEVKDIKIASLLLHKSADGLRITAPYSWLDVTGKTIRQGVNNYKEADLVASFAGLNKDFAPVATILKSLVPDSANANCQIQIDTMGNMTARKSELVNANGGGRYNTTKLDATQFLQAVSPMTLGQLQEMIGAFCGMVLA